jgi:polyisoprenoid-binding protein YceI
VPDLPPEHLPNNPSAAQSTFVSTSVRRDGEELVLDRHLTIKDQTHPVEARGTITDPTVTFGDVVKIGVSFEAVIDRTKYGLQWNAPLPKGGVALGNDVKITVELELAQTDA